MLMFFIKYQCKRCNGTGVREPKSYFLGETFLWIFLDLALPVGFLLAGIYILYCFVGLGLLEYFVANPHVLLLSVVGICILLILLIWYVPPMVKSFMFGKCELCGGSGKNGMGSQDHD